MYEPLQKRHTNVPLPGKPEPKKALARSSEKEPLGAHCCFSCLRCEYCTSLHVFCTRTCRCIILFKCSAPATLSASVVVSSTSPPSPQRRCAPVAQAMACFDCFQRRLHVAEQQFSVRMQRACKWIVAWLDYAGLRMHET
ncbi:hypothetical protein HPB48_008970 [Haemaphysalis longicornis]|uniref:Uncharacterized protein n=1 Tax=Haemaphysalis longicornis TaxID=44386 RepID=A0A9J6G8C6_HAELO|nr:hypothetical protein HPB48_008970 [Haemaphysalis longicornis]